MTFPYIYCTVVTLAQIIALISLGWFVYKGASTLLIIVMLGLGMSVIIPASRFFKCPNCGYTDKIDVFTTHFEKTIIVRSEENNSKTGEK